MQKLTDKQKKAGWIIAAVLLMVHFAPTFLTIVRQQFSHRAPARAVPVRPPAAALPGPVVAPALPVTTEFLGIWTGSALTPTLETCQVRLEMRPAVDKPGFFSGFETRSCVPTGMLVGGRVEKDVATLIRDASPISAIMTGSVINGDMVFQVEKTVGAQTGPCQLTGYSASPFGTGQLMAQWQEGSCPGGHMLLTRARG